MNFAPELVPFWKNFTAACGPASEGRLYEVFSFGDNQPTADALADLVLRDSKRATASLLRTDEADGKRPPQAGDLSIVTSWSGRPLCVIETRSIEVVPFHRVTADFARAAGEGDGSLAYWRQGHLECFTRECSGAGRQFAEDMLVVCERFDVLYREPAGHSSK